MPPPQEIVIKILNTIVAEVMAVAPKIFFALLALAALALVGKLLHSLLAKALKFTKIDEGLAKLLGSPPPISPSKAIVAAADLGVILIGVLLILNILVPEELRNIVTEGLLVVGKVISVLVIALIVLTAFYFLIEKVKVEAKLRSYLIFISFLILTMLLVDISALSPEVKTALVSGLSQGVGLSIAVFAIWFFFGDQIEKYLSEKTSREKQNSSSPTNH